MDDGLCLVPLNEVRRLLGESPAQPTITASSASMKATSVVIDLPEGA